VDRLAAAVDDLLESERRHRSSSTSEVELLTLVGEIVDRWRPRAHSAGRAIELAPGAPVTAQVSSEVVGSVVDVLLDNALRHGSGTIEVDVTELASHLRICVADEGSRSTASDVLHRPPDSGEQHLGALVRAAELVESVGGYLRVGDTEHTSMMLMLPKAHREQGAS
jgi:K+-sensing histidine kinase KdpD